MHNNPIEFIHLRHATSILKIGNRSILVDPMLAHNDCLSPVPLTPNGMRNPMLSLPIDIDAILRTVDALLLTHLHFDHFDKMAAKKIPLNTPIVCARDDRKRLARKGFSALCPVDTESEWGGIQIARYPAIHGKGLLKVLMGKGSSYLLAFQGFTIFFTGDCLWSEALKNRLIQLNPDVVVANGGAATFKFGKPITMSIADIQQIAALLPQTKVLVVHLDALNHCSQTRSYSLEQTLNSPNIYIPENGEKILLN